MTTIYGPDGWNAREAAKEGMEGFNLLNSVERGRAMWDALGYQPHAEEFWAVIAPMVYALAAEEDTGYGEGYSPATACEQLMHEVAISFQQEDLR